MNVLSKKSHEETLAEQFGTGTFWTLEVDGQVITENARPFDASSDNLILSECTHCYFCGVGEISVRRYGSNTILWYVSLRDSYEPKIPRDTILVFDRREYENEVGGDASLIPELSMEDISQLLLHLKLPDWRLGLYTTPELPNDWLGQASLRLLTESLSSPEIKVSNFIDMESEIELRIGIDVPGIPETVVQIQTKDDIVWIQLVENPWFPVWISHPDITKQLPVLIENSEIAL